MKCLCNSDGQFHAHGLAGWPAYIVPIPVTRSKHTPWSEHATDYAITQACASFAPFGLRLRYDGPRRDGVRKGWIHVEWDDLGRYWGFAQYPTGRTSSTGFPRDRLTIRLNYTVPASLRHSVILHEFGHCVGLRHLESGIMAPVLRQSHAPSWRHDPARAVLEDIYEKYNHKRITKRNKRELK